MAKDKKITHSFAHRLSFWLLVKLLITLLPIGWLIFWLVDDANVEQTEALCKSNQTVIKEHVRRQLSDIHVAVDNYVVDLATHVDDPDMLHECMVEFIALNPKVSGCSFAFEPNYFPERGRWYELYAKADSSGTIRVRQIGGPSHDYFSTQWYQGAKKAQASYWSDPYLDLSGAGELIVTYAIPVCNRKGKTVAVFGADLSLEGFADYLAEIDSLNADTIAMWDPDRLGSHSFLLGRDGTYITHKDKSRILRQNFFKMAMMTLDTIDDCVVRDMKKGVEGYAQLDIDSVPSYIYYTPVKHTNWQVVTVVPKQYVHMVAKIISYVLYFLMGLAILVITVVSMKLSKRMAKPLKLLAESADQVAAGNFEATLPEIKYKDEIRLLRDSFETMQQSLSRYMTDLEQATASKAAIEKELKIAYNIQMSMVPQKYPPYPKRTDIDIYGQMIPAKAVGGDLFDFFIRDERLFFCLGDVSGKGVPAALFMSVAKKLFHSIAGYVDDPSLIIKYMNDSIGDGNDANMFVTLFIGVLDLATGHLCYCNGGHEAPLLIGQEVSWLSVKSNCPVGLMPGMSFKGEEADIAPHTTIFLYTDGLTEAQTQDEQLFGKDRLIEKAQCLTASEAQQPKHVVEHMLDSVHAFVGEAEQSDDLTMMAITYYGNDNINT